MWRRSSVSMKSSSVYVMRMVPITISPLLKRIVAKHTKTMKGFRIRGRSRYGRNRGRMRARSRTYIRR
jgi:hypothetical protein